MVEIPAGSSRYTTEPSSWTLHKMRELLLYQIILYHPSRESMAAVLYLCRAKAVGLLQQRDVHQWRAGLEDGPWEPDAGWRPGVPGPVCHTPCGAVLHLSCRCESPAHAQKLAAVMHSRIQRSGSVAMFMCTMAADMYAVELHVGAQQQSV